MHAIQRSQRPCARTIRCAILTALLLVASVAAAAASVPVELVGPVSPTRPITVVDPRSTTVRKIQTPTPMPIRPMLAPDLGQQLIEATRNGLGLVRILVAGQ